MRRRERLQVSAAAAAATAALIALAPVGSIARSRGRAHPGPCLVPGTSQTIDQIWHPRLGVAIRYVQSRVGDIAFAVRTDNRFYGYRADHQEWSASVVKVMLLAAYLDQPSVANRPLDSYDTSLLFPMITESDNNAAQQVFDTVGQSGLQAVANQVGMTNFATSSVWGETEITARDQTTFFLHLENYIPPMHRNYAMWLLAHITPSQRWGIGEVAPQGWALFFKGGWGYGTGLLDHQVVLLARGCARVSIAILTMHDGSHDYGKQTLHDLFTILLQGFPIGPPETSGQEVATGATEGEWQQASPARS